MSEWTIYWITRLDSIKTLLGVLGGVGSVGAAYLLAIGGILRGDGDKGAGEALHRVCKRWAWLPLVVLVGAVLTPRTRDMAAILVIPAVANSEAVQEIGADLHTLAREWLKAQIEEVKK